MENMNINDIIENVCERNNMAWKSEDGEDLCCKDYECPFIKEKGVMYVTDHIDDYFFGRDVRAFHNSVCGVYDKEKRLKGEK